MSRGRKSLLMLFVFSLLGLVGARLQAADEKTVELAKKEGRVSF